MKNNNKKTNKRKKLKSMNISEMLLETEDELKWALRHSPSCKNMRKDLLKEIIKLLELMKKIRVMNKNEQKRGDSNK